ncbi:hypothetical protein CAEBREN_22791 [Caenorhabditis brenneri]|uniref:SH3 domain-containing protein n=1 Tax=Caenorhabditis brenneri TaxID=135651 RepID=G0P1M4_CAEBE|nr:hypothetical protein CAEBREN_22791 [Caenorhabditis brenneri]
MYLVSRRTKAVVTSTYKPRLDDELGLIKGEHVYIVKKSAHGFWKGQTTNGCCGWFPSNCVMEIEAAVEEYQRSTDKSADTAPGPSQPQAQKPSPSEQNEAAISKKGPTSEKMASLIADLQIGFRLPGTTPNIPAKTTPVTAPVAPTPAPHMSPPMNNAVPTTEEEKLICYLVERCHETGQQLVLENEYERFKMLTNSNTTSPIMRIWVKKYKDGLKNLKLSDRERVVQIYGLKVDCKGHWCTWLKKIGKTGYTKVGKQLYLKKFEATDGSFEIPQ